MTWATLAATQPIKIMDFNFINIVTLGVIYIVTNIIVKCIILISLG